MKFLPFYAIVCGLPLMAILVLVLRMARRSLWALVPWMIAMTPLVWCAFASEGYHDLRILAFGGSLPNYPTGGEWGYGGLKLLADKIAVGVTIVFLLLFPFEIFRPDRTP